MKEEVDSRIWCGRRLGQLREEGTGDDKRGE